MVAGADAWESASDDDGPPDARTIFRQLKDVNIEYAVWVCLTVAEREAVFDFLSIDDYDRASLENAVCKDKGKPVADRVASAAKIKKVMASVVNATAGIAKARGRFDDAAKGAANGVPINADGVSSPSYAIVPVGTVADHSTPIVRTRLAHKFTGLVNQSSTCYLNALLQSLFHLPVFRKAIYSLRVPDGTDPAASIPLALQQLFWSLESNTQRTRTVNLTRAFGWDSAQAAIQHDTHELVRKLFDVLEYQFNEQRKAEEGGEPAAAAAAAGGDDDAATAAKPAAAAAAAAKNPIQHLFCGRRNYYTKCLDADYTSTRQEVLYDIELVVKENPTIEASLKAETTAERLDGSNKYCWEHDDEPLDEKTGKVRKTYHEADRGVAYAELPPVLMMHPNRLDFCMRTFQRVTVDSRWVFGTELDMEPYLESAPNAPANHVAEAQAQKQAEADEAAGRLEKLVAGKTASDDDEPPLPKQSTEVPAGGGGDADNTATATNPADAAGAAPSSAADATTPAAAATNATTTTSGRHKYRLRSVVIHSGAATFGHYYCYVNFNGAWVKFNDESVSDVHVSDVWRDAFSGTRKDQWGYSVSSNTRASLLVYVREDAADECLAELTPADAPSHLQTMLDAETARAEVERQRLEAEARLATVPVIRFDAGGDYAKTLRELRKATERKLDPTLSFVEADPTLADCTLWCISNYFAYSNTYRTAHHAATPVDPTSKVGDLWKARTTYQTNVLLAVPHSVAPPPADGTKPRLLTAFATKQGSSGTPASFAGVYTSLEAFCAAFASQLQPRPAAPLEAAAVHVSEELAAAATTAPVSSTSAAPTISKTAADGGDDDDDIFIPDGSTGEAGNEWNGVNRAIDTGRVGAKAEGSETDVDSVQAGAASEDRGLTPETITEDTTATAPPPNPLHSIYGAGAASSSSTALPVAAAAASTAAAATTLAEPTVIIEAGGKPFRSFVRELVSGDIVYVPYDASAPAAVAAAERAHAIEFSSCDVTLYRLPSAFGECREEDADAPAVTPVTAGGDSADSPVAASRFPTADEAVEVGQIRLIETDTYDMAQEAVAEYLGDAKINPRCIAFRSHSASADAPHKNLAERLTKGYYDSAYKQRTVKDLLSGAVSSYMICKLYYEVLPMPVEEFEAKGLRDFIAIDGSTKRHFWGPKVASYLYADDAKKLRTEACRKLGVPVGRVALFVNDYYGAFVDVFTAPLEVDPEDDDAFNKQAAASAAAAAAAGSSSSAPDAAATTATQPDDADDMPPPLMKPEDTNKDARRRADIIVPYANPTYGSLESSHLIILPTLPARATGRIPAPPAEQAPGIIAANPAEGDTEDRQLRWMLVGVQHATRRSRDDIFGFGCCVYVCESDTGADIRARVLEYLGVSEAAAEKWTLLFMKTQGAAPMCVAKDTRAVDLLPFTPATGTTNQYGTVYAPPRFTGSLVMERPMPLGAHKSGTRSGGAGKGRTGSPEPELRIHATGAALAGAAASKEANPQQK